MCVNGASIKWDTVESSKYTKRVKTCLKTWGSQATKECKGMWSGQLQHETMLGWLPIWPQSPHFGCTWVWTKRGLPKTDDKVLTILSFCLSSLVVSNAEVARAESRSELHWCTPPTFSRSLLQCSLTCATESFLNPFLLHVVFKPSVELS